jgi:hypothetical protein
MDRAMTNKSVEQIFGEEFFMRVSTITWKNGRGYVLVEMVLKYSETSYRIANGSGTFFCAIEKTFDEAYVRICKAIRGHLD